MNLKKLFVAFVVNSMVIQVLVAFCHSLQGAVPSVKQAQFVPRGGNGGGRCSAGEPRLRSVRQHPPHA
jgi:hypothetical protein